MKKIFRFILTLTLLASALTSIYATGVGRILTLQVLKYESPENPITFDPERHRVPTRPLQCTIDPENGVTIPLVDKAEIELYEIYSEDEVCIIATPVEAEFIDTLFSLTGTLEIRISTTEYIYAGYVNI